MDQQFNPINPINPNSHKIIWPIVGAIIITALVAGGGIWYWQRIVNQKIQQDLQEQINSLENQIKQLAQQPQGIVYNDSKYRFSLVFPDSWKGFNKRYITVDFGRNGTCDSVDFGFEGSLFNISIHSKTQWQKISSEEGPVPIYLGENSQYVFAYSIGHDFASRFVQTNREEILSILKTFNLLNDAGNP